MFRPFSLSLFHCRLRQAAVVFFAEVQLLLDTVHEAAPSAATVSSRSQSCARWFPGVDGKP